jgi:hypothetical protein
MSTIKPDIEGKNLYEWEERILTLAASQQANTYFMGLLSKLVTIITIIFIGEMDLDTLEVHYPFPCTKNIIKTID